MARRSPAHMRPAVDATLAAYTLGRQSLLRLRAEPRKTRLGGLVTAALAALVLVAAVVLLAR